MLFSRVNLNGIKYVRAKHSGGWKHVQTGRDTGMLFNVTSIWFSGSVFHTLSDIVHYIVTHIYSFLKKSLKFPNFFFRMKIIKITGHIHYAPNPIMIRTSTDYFVFFSWHSTYIFIFWKVYGIFVFDVAFSKD